MLKKEAEYFGDIVILPFIDRYELVVLKTIAICEYGVRYLCHCHDNLLLYFFLLYCLSTLDKIFVPQSCQIDVVLLSFVLFVNVS
jgi:hypothetical protein